MTWVGFRRASFVEAPAERLAAMRILVGLFAACYLLARAPALAFFGNASASSFHPVGPVTVLSSPLPAPWALVLWLVALSSSVAVTLGYRHRVTGPLFGLSLCWVLAYRNSWGMVFHTENLLVLHALVVGVCRAADAWSLDLRRARSAACGIESPAATLGVHLSADNAAKVVREPSLRYGWPLFALQWVVVLSYVAAGVAKLRASGWDWTLGAELQSHIAFDALRKLELGSAHSPLGAALVRQSWVFAPLAWLTMALELGAPLALLGGWFARVWCAAAWSFHLGVLALMAIVFPYPLLGVAYAPFFRLEELGQRSSQWLESRPAWQRVGKRFRDGRRSRSERGEAVSETSPTQ